MAKILLNIALIDLGKFCREHGINMSGSHVIKNGRGFKYSLLRSSDGIEIATVMFHKSQVPTHSYNPAFISSK